MNSATTITINVYETSSINIGQPYELAYLYSRLYKFEDKMRYKNKFLLQFLHGWIRSSQIELLNRYLNDEAIHHFHPSLQKSSLIICNKVEGVDRKALSSIEESLKIRLQS
ncbi:hypothetical protein [Labilibaculum euxinus]